MRERRFPVVLIALAAGLVSLVLLWFTYYHVPAATLKPQPLKTSESPESANSQIEAWRFDARKHSRNLGLTDEQCDVCIMGY